MNNFPQILLGVVVGALGHQVLGDFQVPRIKSFRKALARKAPQQRGTDDEVVDQNETVNPTPKDDEEVPVESAPKNISKPLKFDDPEVCRKILACENYGEGENLLTNLASRAKPNQRLVRAFEIDNAFATEDKGRKIKFRNEVKSKIQGVNWPSVSNEARSVISNYLQGRNRGSPVRDLGDLVRFVCLRITIFTLFKRDQNELDDADIEDLTSSINDLWAESKAGGEPAESNKTNSQKAMRSVFPKMESGPGKNDLNFILPAYETLWRVVLSCLIEVKFRPGADPEWRRQLTEFYHKKADETSDKKQIQSDKSKITGADLPTAVALIVNEALHLYPSTKSVYRQYQVDNRAHNIEVAADIEKCHRKPEIWGLSAVFFDPSRWNGREVAAKNDFLAFGWKSFLCPAKAEYGPWMIAVLVAALSDQLPPETWTLKLYRQGQEDGHELEDS